MLAKKKHRECLGRAGKPWTKQEVKLAYLKEASPDRRQHLVDGGRLEALRQPLPQFIDIAAAEVLPSQGEGALSPTAQQARAWSSA